jgi:hypothetical protein
MQVTLMTHKRNGFESSWRVRAAVALGLGLGALLGISTPPTRAATIKAHRYNTNHAPAVQKEFASLKALVNSWETSLASSKPVAFFKGLTLTNPDGTLKTHALARLLAWEKRHPATALPGAVPPKAAPLVNQQGQVHDQNQAHQIATTISTSAPPRSSPSQILLPPSSAGSTSTTVVPASQTMSVPEPSSVVSALAMLGLAGGWLRLRRVSPRATF